MKVLKIELESVANVLNLNINPVVFGNGTDKNPWIYSVTLQGSLVLAYNDEYSRDILFDASAEEVKANSFLQLKG